MLHWYVALSELGISRPEYSGFRPWLPMDASASPNVY